MSPLNTLLQVTDQVPVARCSDCKCKRPLVHFEGRGCWYRTCIRCRNSTTRQQSPPSEAMINWDVLDEFYGQFRHNPALPIKVHLPDNLVDWQHLRVISLCISMKRLASCSILSLSMTLQDGQLSPFTLPVQAQASIDNNFQRTDEVYLASLVSPLFLPSDICQLEIFVDTLQALFKWKGYMVAQAKRLRSKWPSTAWSTLPYPLP
ncbi:hypothetical protein DM01DRAFT_1373302 [Hesseltinella vesiculosa]|uniref:Uncharacterized protein n=1 Tax=Hesseltinella vesiculosa TaxID=101127 RepID=A0A1X2GJP6_9FUNG|nr:hypothetical protein DM01DRAFT_1373302 [Hesseltinella vesiculosa]